MYAVTYSLCDYICMYMHVYDFVCLKQMCLSPQAFNDLSQFISPPLSFRTYVSSTPISLRSDPFICLKY